MSRDGKKTGGRDYKPGESGNPKGGPGGKTLDASIIQARKLNSLALARILNEYISLNPEGLKEKLSDPNTDILSLYIGRLLAEGLKQGDTSRLSLILDRLVGKVTDKVEHRLPKPTIIQMRGSDAIEVLGHEEQKDEE